MLFDTTLGNDCNLKVSIQQTDTTTRATGGIGYGPPEEEEVELIDTAKLSTKSGMEIYQLWSLSRVVSTSKLAPDWLHKSEQPIRSQVSKMTQLLTMATTHIFPLPAAWPKSADFLGKGFGGFSR